MPKLQSITLGSHALMGDDANYHKNSEGESVYDNKLTMKGIHDMDISLSDLPSLKEIKGDGYSFYVIGFVTLRSGYRICY